MALQWTPLRRRGGAVVRARQNVQTLEHQTQANVLLAFKLSMVSGNGVNSVPRPNYKTYRKMADVGVQCDSQGSNLDSEPEPAITNSTVAEINTSAEIAELENPSPVSSHRILQRPVSIESSTSSASGEEYERRKPVNSQEVDVDAIFVQQSAAEEEATVQLNEKKILGKTEPDGFVIQEKEKEESTCGLDCLYFTMRCCECTIL